VITEETRKRLSESHKGHKHTVEHKERISKALTGYIKTEEHRRNLSKALTGRKISSEHKRKSTEHHKGMSGKKHSEETKQKMREKSLGRPSWWKGLKRPDLSERMSGSRNPFFGKTQIITAEMREKISKAMKGRVVSESVRKNMSEAHKGHKRSEEALKKWIKSNHIKPNKREKQLFDYIECIFPNEYALNVRAEIMTLGGKIPDIVNVNGTKKLIELYGDFWHKGDDPQERMDYFKQFGWDTLVIWEKELKNEELLKQRIIDFGVKLTNEYEGGRYETT
jgi:G:T-mismatch repair DNA endonuclease (very short patch repair protein)